MSADNHTYLRYECADAFGLTVTTGMEVAGGEDRVLTMAGSQVLGWNLRTCELDFKLGTPDTSTNIGTGQALTAEHITALAVSSSSEIDFIGTGWNSGSIRVFEVENEKKQQLSHSLLDSNFQFSQPLMEPRVVFNGHSTAIQALSFGQSDKLASGCGKGTVVVWDLVSETGLFRLLGHKGGITSLQFTLNDSYLLSTSLDGLAKVWDLEGQCCVQTLLMGGQTQIWSSALWSSSGVTTEALTGNGNEDDENRIRFLTGGVDGKVLVWKVEPPKRKQLQGSVVPEENGDAMQVDNDDVDDLDRVCHCMGQLPIDTTIVAANNERIVSIRYCGQKWIGVLHHNSKSIFVYQIRSVRESQRKRQRRLRRRREKKNQQENSKEEETGRKRGFLDDDDGDDHEEINDGDDDLISSFHHAVPIDAIKASDEFEFYGMVRASHKIRDFLLLQQKTRKKASSLKVVCALSTNSLEVHTLTKKNTKEEGSSKPLMLDMYGHPTGIRSMAISSDNILACTVSKHVTKIWNVARRSCLLSTTPATASSSKASSGCYGLCVVFLPGNTHVVLGTREGSILILDIQSGMVVFEDVDAHGGAVWGLDVCRHQGEGGTMNITLVTGSADKCVKFWDLDEAEEGGHPVLVHTRTLEMSDEVVAVKYSSQFSSSKKLVFVSTLDSTIKVLFEDSLKLFLSLYGHSLPALCVDASDDDALLASGSADKTIKVWGLDFGDTHCTLHGHADSITDIAFIRRTHCFVSSSKDGSVRYWDADRFQAILVLEGHSGEVQCVAVTNGAFILSGGMDRQVRVWERTRDIVFVEEERELMLEQQFDAQAVTDDERNKGTLAILNDKQRGDNEGDNDAYEQPQSEAAVRKSVLSVSSGDRIMEALEQADAELLSRRKKKAGEPTSKNLMLLNMEPAQYISWVLRSIPSADLEQSLLILSLRHIERLFFYLISNLKDGQEIELSCRVAIFLVTTHQRQISLHNSLLIPMRELRRLVRLRLSESRDRIGFNIAALRQIGKIYQENKASIVPDAENSGQDIWAGLGLGSDVAAALQRK